MHRMLEDMELADMVSRALLKDHHDTGDPALTEARRVLTQHLEHALTDTHGRPRVRAALVCRLLQGIGLIAKQ